MSALRRVGGQLLHRASRSPLAFRGRDVSPAGHCAGGMSWRGTTIVAVRKDDYVCVVGDGQVTMGSSVAKNNACKVRRLGPDDRVIAGFAGTTSDALTLFERLEGKLEEHPEQLLRACVSMAKDWRMDKYLRRLDAMLLVVDRDISLYLTGSGDVLEPPDGVIGIGSGGNYAIAAARALVPIDGMDAEKIARRSMEIAANLDIYTNDTLVVECIQGEAADVEYEAAPPDAKDEAVPPTANSSNGKEAAAGKERKLPNGSAEIRKGSAKPPKGAAKKP